MSGDRVKINDGASVQVVRRGSPVIGETLEPNGHFIVEHFRMNKETGIRELIGKYEFPNGITDQGKNAMLNVKFNGATALTTWYLGLIDGAGEVLAATDTYDGIGDTNGWAEFTDYTDAANSDSAVTRPQWNPADSTAKQVINASVIVFDITATGLVNGVFVVAGPNAQTKGDSTASGNELWSTSSFSGGEVSVDNLDQLKVTYFVNI